MNTASSHRNIVEGVDAQNLRPVAIKLADDLAAALMIMHGMPTPHAPEIRREMAATILKDAIAEVQAS
ncbi:hypothetical protein VQ042_15790 [Aurantimonas sp. A2-1-M11]|uniref:hypothetical protein n=1 Tax=Aurantimonas sp. A2-1-M11 TaxID=3113712 RepID=UPI002F95BB53